MNCLSDEDALAVAAGAISDATRARVDAHIDWCDDCRALVVAAASVAPAVSPGTGQPRRGAPIEAHAGERLTGPQPNAVPEAVRRSADASPQGGRPRRVAWFIAALVLFVALATALALMWSVRGPVKTLGGQQSTGVPSPSSGIGARRSVS